MRTRKNTYLHIGDRVTVYVHLGNIGRIFKQFDWFKLKDRKQYIIKGGSYDHVLHELVDALVIAKSMEYWYPMTANFKRRLQYVISDFKSIHNDSLLVNNLTYSCATSSERNWLNMYAYRKMKVEENSEKQSQSMYPFFLVFKETSDRNLLLTDEREEMRKVGLRMK